MMMMIRHSTSRDGTHMHVFESVFVCEKGWGRGGGWRLLARQVWSVSLGRRR